LFIFLAKDRRAKRGLSSPGEGGLTVVLEIGCYSGYSALAWAEALKNVEGAEVPWPPALYGWEVTGGLDYYVGFRSQDDCCCAVCVHEI
jgi:hypothetical protein